jgi:hypothetical protein
MVSGRHGTHRPIKTLHAHRSGDVVVLVRRRRTQVDHGAVIGEILHLDRMGMEGTGQRFNVGELTRSGTADR